MKFVVLKFQHVVVEGRQNLIVALISNEVIDSMVKKGLIDLICELRTEKTYDHVSWQSLVYMSRRLG